MSIREIKINQILFKYMLPSTTGLLVIALYVIIDSIFVGRGVGKDGLAALNIAYPIITCSSAISLMIGMGASTLIGLYRGKKHLESLCLSYIHIFNLLCYCFLLLFIFLGMKQLLFVLGAEKSLENMIKDYIYPCGIGMVFLMISTGWNAAVRNLGEPRYAFLSMLAGAICNVFFDWLFIFPFDMGIRGAAIATSMGQILSFFLLFHFFQNRNIQISLFPRKYSFHLIRRMFSLGFSCFIMEFAAAIALILFNIQFMKYGGEMSVAAFCIVASTFYFFRMLFTGLGQGLQPILSYYYGKREKGLVQEVYRKAEKISMLIAFLSFLLIVWKKEQIMSLYHDEKDFVLYSAQGLLYYSTAIFPVAFNFISISYYQSIGNGKLANLFSLCRSFFFLLFYLYLLPVLFGIRGIWFVFAATELTTALVIYFFQKYKKLS